LETLNVDYTSIGDGTLIALAGSPIRELSLEACIGVTDAGLEGLAGAPKVTRLNLVGCNAITDIGLAALARMEGLLWVRLPLLRYAEISEEAVQRLRSSLPNCTVVQANF
jgi:hypothetical protein